VDSQSLTFFLAKATTLLLAGLLAAAALRRGSAGARHLVWVATLAGVLVLPGLLRLAPFQLEIVPGGLDSFRASANDPRPARFAASMPRPDASVPAGAVAGPIAPVRAAEPAAPTRPRFTLPQILLFCWAAVAAALLVRVLLGSLAARRIVRAARPLEDPRWTPLLRDLADRLDLPDTPRLLASHSVEIPFAWGAWRSTIVLPAAAVEWSEERRQLVLLHELAHVRRRDLLAQELGRLACAAYWFHPLVWTAARRLRAESEGACDDLVLASGARASEYAGHLLDILAAARGHGAPAMALPMARRREFEGRLLAILDANRPRRAPGRPQALGLVGVLASIFVVVAAAAPAPPVVAGPGPAPDRRTAMEPETPEAPPQPPSPRQRRQRVQAAPAEQEQPDHDAVEEEPPASAQPQSERDRDRRDMVVRVLRTDPDASVRRSAAWALAETTRPAEVGVLVAALRDDRDAGVREMAAWALADDRSDDANAALAQALRRDASAEVRATAAWALGQRRRGDAAALVAAIADGSPEVREAALWALGNQKPEAAPAELTAALRDPQSRVRLVAAWALGEILDPATAPTLRAAFAKEEDVEVRRALFRALAFLGDRSPEFLDRAAAAKDPELRSRAVLMLGGLGPGIWPWPWPWPQPRPMP
jgi:beta-lactamase regulating signal transducer with metallopeptidase domain/HEAT repeat protein